MSIITIKNNLIMKKLAVLSMALLFVGASLQSQAQVKQKGEIAEAKKEVKTEKKELRTERIALRKLEGTKVSELAKQQFRSDFGAVPNVQWRRSATFDEATYTKAGHKVTAYYDSGNTLVGTCTIETLADVPAKGQAEIKTKYKGYTPRVVIFFKDNEANDTDMLLYGNQFEDADNYFVELAKGKQKMVVQVTPLGAVSYFANL